MGLHLGLLSGWWIHGRTLRLLARWVCISLSALEWFCRLEFSIWWSSQHKSGLYASQVKSIELEHENEVICQRSWQSSCTPCWGIPLQQFWRLVHFYLIRARCISSTAKSSAPVVAKSEFVTLHVIRRVKSLFCSHHWCDTWRLAFSLNGWLLGVALILCHRSRSRRRQATTYHWFFCKQEEIYTF